MGSLPRKLVSTVATLGAVAAALVIPAPSAYAVPGFARQTGLACEACHTVFPELTPFGRQFKLNAYVFSNTPKVSDINEKRESTLSIGAIPPFSIMFQGSFSSLGSALPDSDPAVPDNAQRDSVQFPQQLSLFYTGQISDNFGAFIQLTWEPGPNSIGIDNTDLRFSDSTLIASRPVVYGVTLNNSPTTQDVWNSTPAWGFPFIASPVTPGTNVSNAPTLLDGNLAQTSAGIGGYLWIDNHLYLELAGYRSAKTNTDATGSNPNDSTSPGSTINGTAPYWRLGWEQNWARNSLFAGTYGIHARTHPGDSSSVGFHGPTDGTTDYAFDAQYQWIGEDNIFSAYATWIHESISQGNPLTAASTSNHLNTKRLTANYYYKHRYGASFQYFNTTGSSDSILYPTDLTARDGSGSVNNSPNNEGAIFEVNYVPWLNTKIGLQYTMFTKFNGSGKNYDGLGRSAADNNTLFLYLWTAF